MPAFTQLRLNPTLAHKLLPLLLCLGLNCPAATPAPWQPSTPTDEERKSQQREACLAIDYLQNYHYADRPFRDIDPKEIISRFLDEIDPDNSLFLASDEDFFLLRFSRTLKPVYLFRGDFQPAQEIFSRFAERVSTRGEWIDQRLAQPFDFTSEDNLPPPADTRPANAAAADLLWEKKLKALVLTEILRGRSLAAATTEISQRFKTWRLAVSRTTAIQVRERFFETVLASFDPHSGYFSADSTRDFERTMSGSIVGIGLALVEHDGHFEIASIAPGSPAEIMSTLRPGDTLEAFAEGDEPLQPATPKAKNNPPLISVSEVGTRVRLSYRTASDELKEVTLTRVQIPSPADRARGAVAQVPSTKGTRRIGWIDLPSFYGNTNGSSSTDDVRELINQMTAQPLDGLVLDLRDNPGGSLHEAVRLCGLFFRSGTVLLTRGLENKAEMLNAPDEPTAYAGPLVVLTSPLSASASEITAAALQHHRRALIVGGPATYGKGTVQTYIPLGQTPAAKAPAGWGTLRLTSQRFTRPDGEPIQRLGVTSDLRLHSLSIAEHSNEAALPHALRAEPVTPPEPPHLAILDGPSITPELLQHLRLQFETRTATLPEFSLLTQETQLTKPPAKDTAINLQITARQQELNDRKAARDAALNTRRELEKTAAFTTTPVEIKIIDTSLKAHAEHLASLLTTHSTLPRLGLTALDQFVAQCGTTWKAIPLSALNFESSVASSAELAAAFGKASKIPVTPENMAAFFVELDLLSEKNVRTFLDCAKSKLLPPGTTDLNAINQGIDSVLQLIVEKSPALTADRPPLDIPLREALRLAADWADYETAHTSISPAFTP